jgi:hypothetical protein
LALSAPWRLIFLFERRSLGGRFVCTAHTQRR